MFRERWTTAGSVAVLLALAGCNNTGGTAGPPPDNSAPGIEAMPAQARKQIPRTQAALARRIEEASAAYAEEAQSRWNRRLQSDEGLSKFLVPSLADFRTAEGWVAQVKAIVPEPPQADADGAITPGPEAEAGKPPVMLVLLRLPEPFVERYDIVIRGENYDRDNGYVTVGDKVLKALRPGDWVKFSGVVRSGSEPHWDEPDELNPSLPRAKNFVWLGVMTLTELARIK